MHFTFKITDTLVSIYWSTIKGKHYRYMYNIIYTLCHIINDTIPYVPYYHMLGTINIR